MSFKGVYLEARHGHPRAELRLETGPGLFLGIVQQHQAPVLLQGFGHLLLRRARIQLGYESHDE